MNINTLKKIICSTITIAGLSTSLTAEAVSFSGTLGASIVAADSYTFTCPPGTVQSRIRVMDLNAISNRTATVFATFGKSGTLTRSVSDTESTPGASLNAINTTAAAGTYNVVVNKSAINTEDYVVTGECFNGVSVPLTATLFLQTNQ